MPKETPKIPTSILKKVAIALFVSIVGTSAIVLFMGAFSKPDMELKVTPAYRFAYIFHVGGYNNVDGLIESVREKLIEADVEAIDAAVMFLDDASVVKSEDQRSKVGFIIPKHVFIPEGLEEMEIPSHEVLVATFHGGALMGSYKSYPAMQDWAAYHGKRLTLPALEIYHGKTSIEYHMAVVDASARPQQDVDSGDF